MKIAIIGSRDFKNTHIIEDYIRNNLSKNDIIVSGGAIGPDTIAVNVAKKLNMSEPIIFLPKWQKYGLQAGFIRNTKIIETCDQVVAFWNGTSKGTKDSIQKAKKLKKPVKIIYDNNFNQLLNTDQ